MQRVPFLALIWLAAAGPVLAADGGTVHGMFGERRLGGFLEPRAISPGSGLVVAPNGVFLGRTGVPGRTTFGPMPWHYQGPWQGGPSNGWPPSNLTPAQGGRAADIEAGAAGVEPGLPPEAPIPPPTEAPPPLPDDWFRSPAPNAGGPVAPSAAIAPAPARVVVGFRGGGMSSPATSLSQLLNRTARIGRLSPIQVSMEGGTLVLRGRVPSADDRLLAETVANMEAGIGPVRNELAVPSELAQADRGE